MKHDGAQANARQRGTRQRARRLRCSVLQTHVVAVPVEVHAVGLAVGVAAWGINRNPR